VEALPVNGSFFWSEVLDTEKLTTDQIVLMDLWQATTGAKEVHPFRELKKRKAEAKKREINKQKIKAMAARRKRARLANST